jgi:hypothetical protein
MLFTCGNSILQHSSIVIVEIVQQLIGGVRAFVIHLEDGMINGSNKGKKTSKNKSKGLNAGNQRDKRQRSELQISKADQKQNS